MSDNEIPITEETDISQNVIVNVKPKVCPICGEVKCSSQKFCQKEIKRIFNKARVLFE